MRRKLAVALAVLLTVLLVPAWLATAAGPEKPLAVGDRAPDFALPDQHGKPVRLSALLAARQYVVLAFYVKAFTPG